MKVTIEVGDNEVAEAIESFNDMAEGLRGKTKVNVVVALNGLLVLAERLQRAQKNAK